MSQNSNGQFRESEPVTKRGKVGNGWETRIFPIVGGRLRIAHEENEQLSIQSEVVRFDEETAVVKATAKTRKGEFCGFGTASATRDARLADALSELAQTRSIARALRFAGFGMEFASAEEVSHVVEEQTESKKPNSKVFDGNRGDKPGSKPQHCDIGRATQAQCRALFALTRKAKYTGEDVRNLLNPMNATAFEELTREAASQLITSLQTEIAA